MVGRSGGFELFAQDDKGPMWRGSFSDLESAKVKAQELANQEGIEFFVFNLGVAQEVARFFPEPKAKQTQARACDAGHCCSIESTVTISPTCGSLSLAVLVSLLP